MSGEGALALLRRASMKASATRAMSRLGPHQGRGTESGVKPPLHRRRAGRASPAPTKREGTGGEIGGAELL